MTGTSSLICRFAWLTTGQQSLCLSRNLDLRVARDSMSVLLRQRQPTWCHPWVNWLQERSRSHLWFPRNHPSSKYSSSKRRTLPLPLVSIALTDICPLHGPEVYFVVSSSKQIPKIVTCLCIYVKLNFHVVAFLIVGRIDGPPQGMYAQVNKDNSPQQLPAASAAAPQQQKQDTQSSGALIDLLYVLIAYFNGVLLLLLVDCNGS